MFFRFFCFLFFILFSIGAEAQIKFSSPKQQNQEPPEVRNFIESLLYNESGFEPFPIVGLDDKKTQVLQENDISGMYKLGMMYLNGANVDIDFKQAKEWFLSAAKLNNSDAMIQLAIICSLPKNITNLDQDTEATKLWIQKAVRLKNPRSYLEIGRMMETGVIFDLDTEKAIKFYQLAAQAGNANAYAKLASMYLFGRGVEQDLRKAINYLRKIQKESKNPAIMKQAEEYLAQIYFDLAMQVPNGSSKFKLFELSWESGNKQAADALGDMYYEGKGIKKNYLKSLEWYERSVKSFESVYGMEKLGFLYLKAPGDVPRDYKRAMDYFQQAARLGGVKGAYMIGYMYQGGFGVPKDDSEAQKWFARSKALEGKSTNIENRVNFITKPTY